MLRVQKTDKISSEDVNIVSSQIAMENSLEDDRLIHIILQLLRQITIRHPIIIKLLQIQTKLTFFLG